mgnify:FL=1
MGEILLEETPITIYDEEESFVSPCAELLAERAAVAREIIWLVVRGEASLEVREQRAIGFELGCALRRQAVIKARLLRSGCLVDPDAPF